MGARSFDPGRCRPDRVDTFDLAPPRSSPQQNGPTSTSAPPPTEPSSTTIAPAQSLTVPEPTFTAPSPRVVAAPEPSPASTPTTVDHPANPQPGTPSVVDCSPAVITSPTAGSRLRPGPVAVTWEPSHCVLAVAYYQNGALGEPKRLGMRSGDVLNLAGPVGQAAVDTEIKVWREGQPLPDYFVWVVVESR